MRRASTKALQSIVSAALLAGCYNGSAEQANTGEDGEEEGAATPSDVSTTWPSSGSGESSQVSDSADQTATTDSSDSGTSTGGTTTETGDPDSSSDTASNGTVSDDSDASDSESGNECDTPRLICDGQCIDPRSDDQYCGAAEDCQGDNAGETCLNDTLCLDGQCRKTGWSVPIELTQHTPTSGNALGVQMAGATDGSVIAVWRQYEREGKNPSAWARRYLAADRQWSLPERLETAPGDIPRSLKVVIDNDDIATAVWPQTIDERLQLRYTRLPGLNASWTIPTTINNLKVGDSNPWALTTDNDNNVHISWVQSQDTLRSQENYSSVYEPDFAAWRAPELIASDTAEDVFPAIMAVGFDGAAFAFWRHRNRDGFSKLRYRLRRPGGGWGSLGTIQDLAPNKYRITDQQAAYGPEGDLTFVWVVEWRTIDGDDHSQLWWARRTIDDFEWTTPQHVVPPDIQDDTPTLHIDNAGTAHLTWIERRPTAVQLWYSQLPRGATTWREQQPLAPAIAIASKPIIRSDNEQNLHAIWGSSTGETSALIVYTAQLPEGATEWVSEHRLSAVTEESNFPNTMVVHPDGDVSVGWRQLDESQAKIWSARFEAGR